MATPQIEKEIIDLERRYWQALKDGDVDTALSLTDFPCMIAGAGGVHQVGEREFKLMMTNPSYAIERVELDDNPQVRLIRDDLAVVAYKVHEEVSIDGKSVSMDANDTSTWIRRDGRWVCAHHTEAIAGDPFGRDRKARAN